MIIILLYYIYIYSETNKVSVESAPSKITEDSKSEMDASTYYLLCNTSIRIRIRNTLITESLLRSPPTPWQWLYCNKSLSEATTNTLDSDAIRHPDSLHAEKYLPNILNDTGAAGDTTTIWM